VSCSVVVVLNGEDGRGGETLRSGDACRSGLSLRGSVVARSCPAMSSTGVSPCSSSGTDSSLGSGDATR